jgi:hypothetical protein
MKPSFPRLRSDLLISRQAASGEAHVVIKDPLTRRADSHATSASSSGRGGDEGGIGRSGRERPFEWVRDPGPPADRLIREGFARLQTNF